MENKWEKSKLLSPKIFEAYNNDKYFFVYRDDSTILFLISKDKKISYAIPKKYSEIIDDKYYINDIEKLIPISCKAKDKYENFVLKNLFKK